jgi:hypothetical protein
MPLAASFGGIERPPAAVSTVFAVARSSQGLGMALDAAKVC